MMRKYLFCMVLTGVLMVFAGWASGADIYVATNGTPGAATNWATAYTNIQTALDEAASNDTIYLAGHTFLLTNQLNWTSCSNVSILGGYAATNDADQPGSYDTELWPTVIARSGAFDHRILFITNVTAGTLERVTITSGYQPDVSGGGGILLLNCGGVMLSGCVITNNKIQGNGAPGGGICSKASIVTVSNCLVRGNSIYCANGGYGGGIYTGGGGAMTLRDSIIANNKVYGGYVRDGGGIWAGTTCVLRNCLVLGNTASEDYYGGYYKHGDGFYVSGGYTRLENCTVAYNAGHGIYQSAGTVTVTNSIVWGNGDDVTGTVTLAYCDIENGDSNGVNGNIMADPLFERGYYLATNSPCTNAGTNDASYWGLSGYTTRTDGSNDTGRVDMGYHYLTGYDFSCGDFYVATNGDDANSGTNPASPFRTITKALSVTRDGTRIHVGSGTYNTNGLEAFPLTVGNLMGVQILGTNRATTVINAAGSNNRVMSITNCNNVAISELTLTGGYQSGTTGGGGILLSCCGGVMLSGLVITNNRTQGNYANGGGICSMSSVATARNCLVTSNTIICANGGLGGGVYAGGGGAMMLYDSIIANNLLTAGLVRRGGGIWADATCVLRNCLVFGNNAWLAESSGYYKYGDGIFVNGGSTRLENCTVAYNIYVGATTNQGIYRTNGVVTATNSIVWGHEYDILGTNVTLGWSNIGDGTSAGTNGCISADPLFEGPATNNYRLGKGSPCINAGINLAWMIGAGDLDGTPRINTKTVDMGAYEVQLPPCGTVFLAQ